MSSLTMVFGFFCAPIYIYIYIYYVYYISIIYIYYVYYISIIYISYIYIYILYIYNGFGGIKDLFFIKCCKKCHFTDLHLLKSWFV